jgi:release factor glutamine methyltransferase
MTGAEALALAVRQLRDADIEDPARDARWLLAHTLGLAPERLTLVLPEPIAGPEAFFALIDRRAGHEPVAKITGLRQFRHHVFRVTPAVLDPRPETELVVELALAEPFHRMLDLGTGSGCILLSVLAERPGSHGLGTDISAEALAVAAENVDRLGLGDRVRLVRGDWFDPVEGHFELIVSNPPYVSAGEMAGLAPEVRDWDPAVALTDRSDGLEAYRKIFGGALCHLAPGGRLIVEIGWRQGPAVMALARAAGLDETALHTDLEGRDRVLSARNPR